MMKDKYTAAALAMEVLDKDRWAAKQSVDQILHLLRDVIPRACFREAEDILFDAFFINSIELTSSLMRKEYEAHKRMELNLMMTSSKALLWHKNST